MALLLFPDNTVLINFAYLHRMDLLQKLARNPVWCGTVASECARSSLEPDLEDLTLADGIFGEPLRPANPVEHLAVATYKTRLDKPGDGRYKNLGEAETLALIDCRSLQALFVTDDQGVAQVVSQQGSAAPQVTVVTTWELLRVAARSAFVDHDTLWSYVHVLRNKKRHQPPCRYEREAFEAWLGQ